MSRLVFSEWTAIQNPLNHTLDIFSSSLGPFYGRKNIDVFLRNWISHIPLPETDVLIIYGLGLGYPFQCLKPWLETNSIRKVIFIEDDLEIIAHTMSHPEAEELIKHPQVEILFIQPNINDLYPYFYKITERNFFRRVHFTALPFYQTEKTAEFDRQKFFFDYCLYLRRVSASEVFDLAKDFHINLWNNFRHLSYSHPFLKMRGGMKGVPAIVVGAGPSLEKNIEQLKGLKDKALIIAGGTAVNVLNAYHIDPDLIVGLDPFESSYSRAVAMTSFEKPLVYKPRYLKDALDLFSAPLIYIDGGWNIKAEDYIRTQLGFDFEEMDLGTNVVNTAVKIAAELGCNPIITLGVDLAYTEKKSYGVDISPHAITPNAFKTRTASEPVVTHTDIYGKPIGTLLKWIDESFWYGKFQDSHPEITIINCTEGGIGFTSIPNSTLKEATEIYLTQNHDIIGKLHVLREESLIPQKATLEHNRVVRQELLEDLVRCQKKLAGLYEKYSAVFSLSEIEKATEGKEQAETVLNEIKESISWQGLVKGFDDVYVTFLKSLEEDDKLDNPILIMTSGRLGFMKKVIDFNVEELKKSLELEPVFYPSIKTSVEIDASQTGAEEVLYAQSGKKLAASLWKEGKREGKTTLWYQDGTLFANLNFKQGAFDGIQEYFYPCGALRSRLSYNQGLLDFTSTIYWPDKKLKRVINFLAGKRHGEDRYWSAKGNLIFEAFYKENVPVGAACRWTEEGKLINEIHYDDCGKITLLKERVNGELIDTKDKHDTTYLDFVSKNTENLTNSLDSVLGSLEETFRALEPSAGAELSYSNELAELKMQLQALHSIGGDLNLLANEELKEENTENQISTVKAVESDLGNLAHQFKRLTEEMNFQIESARKKLKEK